MAHVRPFAQASEAFSYGTPNLHQTSGFFGGGGTGEGEGEKGGEGRGVCVVVCVRGKGFFFVSTISDLRNCAAKR